MKKHQYALRFWFAIGALFAVVSPSWAGVIVKANNTDALNLASSWTNGVAPGANDIATWDGTTAANTVLLGANLAWQGLAVDATHSSGAIEISTGNTLTLGSSGIKRVGNVILTLRNDIAFATDQDWDIGGANDFNPRGTINTQGHSLSYSTASSIQNFGYFTGGGAVAITKGALRFSSGSTSGGGDSPITVLPGSTLNYDAHTGSKVLAKSVTLIGGTLRSIGDQWNPTADTITEALAIDRGGSTVTLTTHSTRNIRLTPAELVRSNNGVVLFRSTGLGVNPVDSLTPNSGNITFSTPPTLVGAGGVAGSSTNGILVGAYGDTLTTTAGTGLGATGGLVTYDASKGIRLLDYTTEYASTIIDGQTQLDNVRLANSGGTPMSLSLTADTTINSLSCAVSGTTGSGITINGGGKTLTLNSGVLWASDIVANSVAADKIVLTNLVLNLGNREGVVLAYTSNKGGSSNSGGYLEINAEITGDGGKGVTYFLSGGNIQLNGTTANTYTGDTVLNGGIVIAHRTGAGLNTAVPGNLVINAGTFIDYDNQIADSKDVTIYGGKLLLSRDSNNANAASDTIRNITLYGGSADSGSSGRLGTFTIKGTATLFGGTISPSLGQNSTQFGRLTIHGMLTLAGGSLISKGAYNSTSAYETITTLNGGVTITNTPSGAYVPITVATGSSYLGGKVVLAGDLTFAGHAANANTTTIDAPAGTRPGIIEVSGTRTFNIGNGPAQVDLAILPAITGGGFVKTGAGTLALDGASTFTGGTSINEGTLTGTGSLASDLTVASGATLAPGTPDAVGTFTVNADVDFEAGSILDLDIDGETADLLAVSGTVTGTATIPVAQDQATGEWKIMTAGSFDADFVSTNPRWSLSKRNGGTELWLARIPATTIVIK